MIIREERYRGCISGRKKKILQADTLRKKYFLISGRWTETADLRQDFYITSVIIIISLEFSEYWKHKTAQIAVIKYINCLLWRIFSLNVEFFQCFSWSLFYAVDAVLSNFVVIRSQGQLLLFPQCNMSFCLWLLCPPTFKFYVFIFL